MSSERIRARRETVRANVQAGLTPAQIAEIVDASVQTVRSDIKALRKSGDLPDIDDGTLARQYIDRVYTYLHERVDELDPELVAAGGDYLKGTVDAHLELAKAMGWQDLVDRFADVTRRIE